MKIKSCTFHLIIVCLTDVLWRWFPIVSSLEMFFSGLWKIGHSQSHPGQVAEYKTINFFGLRWLIIKLIYHRTGSFSCWMSSHILCLILSSVFAPAPTVLKNVPKGRNIFMKWHSCATASHSVTAVCWLYGKWDHTAAKWLIKPPNWPAMCLTDVWFQ